MYLNVKISNEVPGVSYQISDISMIKRYENYLTKASKYVYIEHTWTSIPLHYVAQSDNPELSMLLNIQLGEDGNELSRQVYVSKLNSQEEFSYTKYRYSLAVTLEHAVIMLRQYKTLFDTLTLAVNLGLSMVETLDLVLLNDEEN